MLIYANITLLSTNVYYTQKEYSEYDKFLSLKLKINLKMCYLKNHTKYKHGSNLPF